LDLGAKVKYIKYDGEVKMIELKQECKISRDISKRILCLPIYAELEQENQEIIISLIKGLV